VTAAARAAAVAVLVGGGLLAVNARPREGGRRVGGSSGCFVCCEQVQGMARRQRMIGSEQVPQQVAACCDRAVTVL